MVNRGAIPVYWIGHARFEQQKAALSRREECQQHFALFANQTEKPPGLVLFIRLQVGIAHDDHLDGRILNFGVGGGEGQSILIEENILDRRVPFAQSQERSRLAGRDFYTGCRADTWLRIRVWCLSNGTAGEQGG